MSQPGGGEVPAEESTSSKTSIEEEKRGMEGDNRGNPTSRSSQVVCVILSSEVPHFDTAISPSRCQEFSTRGKTVKATERNWASVDASESSGHLEKIDFQHMAFIFLKKITSVFSSFFPSSTGVHVHSLTKPDL